MGQQLRGEGERGTGEDIEGAYVLSQACILNRHELLPSLFSCHIPLQEGNKYIHAFR